MGHGTFCSKKLLGHSITKSPKSIGSSHIFFTYSKKTKKQFFSVKLLGHHTYILGILLDHCWTYTKKFVGDDLAEIWYVYSRLTNQSLISQGSGGGGRGQTDSHTNLTNYGGMGRNFLM